MAPLVRLADFGLATSAEDHDFDDGDEEESRDVGGAGTVRWMGPEQLRLFIRRSKRWKTFDENFDENLSVHPRFDLWSFGLLLLRLFSGVEEGLLQCLNDYEQWRRRNIQEPMKKNKRQETAAGISQMRNQARKLVDSLKTSPSLLVEAGDGVRQKIANIASLCFELEQEQHSISPGDWEEGCEHSSARGIQQRLEALYELKFGLQKLTMSSRSHISLQRVSKIFSSYTPAERRARFMLLVTRFLQTLFCSLVLTHCFKLSATQRKQRPKLPGLCWRSWACGARHAN